MCLLSRSLRVQLSHQRFGDRPGGLETTFRDFCNPVVIRSVYMIRPCSTSDYGPSYDTSNLANIMNVCCDFYPLLSVMHLTSSFPSFLTFSYGYLA